MEVEVAVQGHGGDNHAVAMSIEPFEHLFAPVVTLPVFGCDQGEFDTRKFYQLFEFALRGARDERF